MLFSVHLGYFPYNPQEYTKKHWYCFFFEFLPQKDRWKHFLRNEELVKFIPGEKNELNVPSPTLPFYWRIFSILFSGESPKIWKKSKRLKIGTIASYWALHCSCLVSAVQVHTTHCKFNREQFDLVRDSSVKRFI
jgi:hypothetical protein